MAKSLDERFKERNFLPALKPRKWQARKTVFCRRLVDNEHETVPLVAYGWDAPDRTEFVTREAISDAGASKSKAHKYALRNLARRARKVTWTKERYPMGRKKVAVAMVEGDEFTGSFVLVPEFLEAAHELLDCETLVIGIPHRFALWACDASLAPLMVSFAESQFEEAEEDEREPVTPALILSQRGKLAGIATGEEEGSSKPSRSKERPSKTEERKTKERPSKTKERKAKERPSKTKERPSKTKERKTKERPSKTKERPSKTKERPSKTKERPSKTKERKTQERPSTKRKPRAKKSRAPESSEDIESDEAEEQPATKKRSSKGRSAGKPRQREEAKPKPSRRKSRKDDDDGEADESGDEVPSRAKASKKAGSKKKASKKSSSKKETPKKKGPAPRKKRRW